MIHIVALEISEQQNLVRVETELNFYFYQETRRPHLPAQKAPKSQKAAG